MIVEIRNKPSFAALFVTLLPGESITAESDAMASMSGATVLTTQWNGGFLRAVMRRWFGGESLFVNAFSCPNSARQVEVVLTQPTPGDITEVALNGQTLCLQPGAFIACTPGVILQLGWAGFASWIGGEGLFRLLISGQGKLWMGGYGGLFTKQVDGEYVVDTGHLLAYEPTLSLSVGLSGGLFSSLFGGEGLITRVRGQGLLYLQSRSMEGLAGWTNQHL